MRQLAIALLFGLCSATAWAQEGGAIKDDDAAAVRAAAVTDEYRLTSIKTTCLYFDTVDKGKAYLVRVRNVSMRLRHRSALI
jgi:hypothetical protein